MACAARADDLLVVALRGADADVRQRIALHHALRALGGAPLACSLEREAGSGSGRAVADERRNKVRARALRRLGHDACV
jgi:hypothetical protein